MFLSSNRTNNRLLPENRRSSMTKASQVNTLASISQPPTPAKGTIPENRSNQGFFDPGSDSDEGEVPIQAQPRPSSSHLRASKRMLPGTFIPVPVSPPAPISPSRLHVPFASSPRSTNSSNKEDIADIGEVTVTTQVTNLPHDYEDDFEESVDEGECVEENTSPAPEEEEIQEQWATSIPRAADLNLGDSLSPPPWGESTSEPPWGDDPPWTANEEETWTAEEPAWGDKSPTKPKPRMADLAIPSPRPGNKDNLHLTTVSTELTPTKLPRRTPVKASEPPPPPPPPPPPQTSSRGDTSAFNRSSFFDEVNVHNWLLKFDDIEMGEPLGSGGFGTVYKGRLKYSNDVIAVKVCLCQDADMVAAFKREVKMLSSLRHEHIVLFRGACIDIPHMCIVTELMCRGNLYNILHDEDMDMSWKLRVRWARDIARGMNYLHTLNPAVIHRDLKSPNVLVNDYYMIKLCDFGMSRTKQHTMIQTKQMGGSPLWMAPECLRGEPFSEKSDVYSFGVLLWEIMTREVPWEDKEVVQLVGLVGFKNQTLPIPPLSHYPGCPESYVTVMQECWAASPHDRPSFRHTMPLFEEMAIHAR